MKILVTGSEGYLGVPLTQVLIKHGHEVVGLDTGFYRNAWLFNGVKKLPQLISKDTRLVTAKDLEGFDAIVHLAELSNDPLGQIDKNLTYSINHLGTVNLIKAAKKAGVKQFIYFSSCSIYGASEEIATEETTPQPLTEYAKCKVLNEKYLLKQAGKSFSPIILRNATAFGPSPRMRFDLAINNLAAWAFTTHQVKLESNGNAWRPFAHVLDIAEAVVAVLAAPKSKVHAQIFNVGGIKANYQIKDVAEMIAHIIPGSKVVVSSKSADKRNYRVNFSKIHVLLPDFSGKRTVNQGIDELYRLFRQISLTKADFESKDYTRLKQIQYLVARQFIDKQFLWRI